MEYGWNDEVSNAWALEQCFHSAGRVYALFGHAGRLGLLGVPGFHGANDPERCLDWLDIQFGRRPDTWRNEFRFAWDWDVWRRGSGAMPPTGAAPPRPATIRTAEAWPATSGDIRAALAALLGERPPYIEPPVFRWPGAPRGPTPGPTAGGRGGAGQVAPDVPAWVIARRIQEFGWLSPEQDEVDSRRIRFGSGVTGDLYFPKGTPEDARLPTVIWLHGASYPLGYMWVYRRDLHPILALTKAGFAVLAYDQCGFGARQEEAGAFYQRYPRWSQMGRMVEDVSRGIDALEKEGIADAKRISLLGYTLGGTTALLTGALDPRVQGVVAISGFTPMRTDTADRGTGGVARYSHLRGLIPQLGFFVGREQDIPVDFDAVLAAIAPRPVLIMQPQLDRSATPADVRDAVENARRIYTLFDASNRLALDEPLDYVRLPAATQDRIIAWMKANLTSPATTP
jgi:dienelactone hydrolase